MSKDKDWKKLLDLIVTFESPALLKEFLGLILTFEEREILSSRFLIINALLEKELTQREISERHKVSISQITRGSNALKISSNKLKDFLKEQML